MYRKHQSLASKRLDFVLRALCLPLFVDTSIFNSSAPMPRKPLYVLVQVHVLTLISLMVLSQKWLVTLPSID